MNATTLEIEYFYPNSIPGRTLPHVVQISTENFSAASLVAALVSDSANLKQYPIIRYEKLGSGCLKLLKPETTLEDVGKASPITLWLEAGDMPDLVADAISLAQSGECHSMQFTLISHSEAAQQFLAGFETDSVLQRTFWNYLDRENLWNKPLLSHDLLQHFKEEPFISQITVDIQFGGGRSGRLNKRTFTAKNIEIKFQKDLRSSSNEFALHPFALFVDHYCGNCSSPKPWLQQAFVDSVIKQLAQTGLYANQLLLIKEQCLNAYTRITFAKRPHGALLYGPPGTGKSYFCLKLLRALAPQARLLYFGSAPSLFGGKVGETEKRITELFNKSRTTPYQLCFIFLDEFDSIAESRTAGNQQDFKKDFLNHLISLLGSPDYSNVFLVAATNFKDKLDEAVLRWGRASEHFLFAALSSSERLERLKESKIEVLESQIERYLDATLNFTIAMLDELFSAYQMMDTKTFERLIDKANTLSFKYPITKFNTYCLMPANNALEASRNNLFMKFLVESTVTNIQENNLNTGRIIISIGDTQARIVFEKTNGAFTSWDEDGYVSKGSIMKRLQLFAKMLDLQHVRVINRKFYLDHEKTFYNSVKEAIQDESRCYKGSMFVFMVGELIIAEPTQIGFSFSESDNESWSNQIGVTSGTTKGDALGINTNLGMTSSTSQTLSEGESRTTGSHTDVGTSTNNSKGNQRTLARRRDGESKSASVTVTSGSSRTEGVSKQYSTSTSHSDTTSTGQSFSAGESYTHSVGWNDSKSFTSSTTFGSQLTKGMTTTFQILNPAVMADLQLIFQETLNCANEQLPHVVFVFEGVPAVIVQKMEVSANWCSVGNISGPEQVKETNLNLLSKCLSNKNYRQAAVTALLENAKAALNPIKDAEIQSLLPDLLPLLGVSSVSDEVVSILGYIKEPTLQAFEKLCNSGALDKLVELIDAERLSQSAISSIIKVLDTFTQVFSQMSRLSIPPATAENLLASLSSLIPLLMYHRKDEVDRVMNILRSTSKNVGPFKKYSRFALVVRILADVATNRHEYIEEIGHLMSSLAETESCAAIIVQYKDVEIGRIMHVEKAQKTLKRI